MSKNNVIFKIILSLLVLPLFFVDERSIQITIGIIFLVLLFGEEVYETKIKKKN